MEKWDTSLGTSVDDFPSSLINGEEEDTERKNIKWADANRSIDYNTKIHKYVGKQKSMNKNIKITLNDIPPSIPYILYWTTDPPEYTGHIYLGYESASKKKINKGYVKVQNGRAIINVIEPAVYMLATKIVKPVLHYQSYVPETKKLGPIKKSLIET